MKIQLSQKDLIAALDLYFSKTFNKPMRVVEFDFTASRRPYRNITIDVDVQVDDSESKYGYAEEKAVKEIYLEAGSGDTTLKEESDDVVKEEEVIEEDLPDTSSTTSVNLFG